MASGKTYLQFILEQLQEVDGVTYRAMMGEYILYYKGKIFGGIFDDRLMVKPVAAAKERMPDAPAEPPYPGVKEMLVVENVDDRLFMKELLEAMGAELPMPKKKTAR